jgi:diaminopimelate decarboxylase
MKDFKIWQDLSNSGLIQSIAKTVGTPAYIYSEQVMRQQYQRLQKVLPPSGMVCFAVKACSNLAILSFFKKMGAGFDIVSGGELKRVLISGGRPKEIVFSGVGKTEEEMVLGVKHGILSFNVESEGELRALERVARELNSKAPVAFRVNPNVPVETHPYLSTGLKTSKFGIDSNTALELCKYVSSSSALKLVGLSCHIGSEIKEIAPLRAAYFEMAELAEALMEQGVKIEFVDFGGGFGIDYQRSGDSLDLEKLSGLFQEVSSRLKSIKFLVEPGKFLIAPAGVLLTKVLYRKSNHDNQFAVVDAGMNDLIRPALYKAYHHIEVVGLDDDRKIPISIVGPVCETGCFFAKDRLLPDMKEGDLLLIRDAGAYGSTMASNYNTRPLPAEVLVRDDGSYSVIRQRQSLEQIWENESMQG